MMKGVSGKMWDMQKVAQALLDVYAEYKCPDILFTVTLTPKDAPPEKGKELCPVQ